MPPDLPPGLLTDHRFTVSVEPVSMEVAARLLRTAWGLIVNLRPLAGERDGNFRLRCATGADYVLKVAHPAESVSALAFQSAMLGHAAARDPALPLPQWVPTMDGADGVWLRPSGAEPRRAYLLTYLPGQPLSTVNSAAWPSRRMGTVVARLATALLDFGHPAELRELPWDLQAAAALKPLLPCIGDASARALSAAALDRFASDGLPRLSGLQRGVIHNDLNPGNVLVVEDEVSGIIDFGDALRAPLVQEVAVACTYLVDGEAEPLAHVAAFMRGYDAVLPLLPAELEILPDLMAARMAMTLCISAWRAARQPANSAYILRNAPGAARGLAALRRIRPSALLTALEDR